MALLALSVAAGCGSGDEERQNAGEEYARAGGHVVLASQSGISWAAPSGLWPSKPAAER